VNLLTPTQITFLQYLKKTPLVKDFYLTGGTALAAFYLFHRYSFDLDFFTKDKENIKLEYLLYFLKQTPDIKEVYLEKIHKRRIFTLQWQEALLKVEFTFYPYKNIAPLQKREGIFVNSLEDIFVNKLLALADREETKDLIDVYFILKEKGLDFLLFGLKEAQKKFGIRGIEFIVQRKFLNLPEKIEDVPYLIKPLLDFKAFLKEAAVLIAQAYWKNL